MMGRWPRWRPYSARGVATVEMAIVLPILLLLVVATAELGRAFVQYTTLSNAVRDGARYVAGKALRGTTATVNLSGPLISETRNVVVYGTSSGGSAPVLPGLAANQISLTQAGGNVSVTAVYPYQSLFGGLPGFGTGGSIDTTFNMRIVVTMRPFG